MILPQPDPRIGSMTALVQLKAPVRTTSMTRCQSAGSISDRYASLGKPALLTRMSTVPSRSVTAARSTTSAATPRAGSHRTRCHAVVGERGQQRVDHRDVAWIGLLTAGEDEMDHLGEAGPRRRSRAGRLSTT